MDWFVFLFVGLRELDAWPTHGLREDWVQVLIIGKTVFSAWHIFKQERGTKQLTYTCTAANKSYRNGGWTDSP